MYETKSHLNGLLVRSVRWSVKTAGPSPDENNRTEIFLLGCSKAMKGNPCKGCFNSSTWDPSKAEFSHDPFEMAKHINENAPNKYITIGGGEPVDQIDNLIVLCTELKKYGFHVMVYTHLELKNYIGRSLVFDSALSPESIFREKLRKLAGIVDIIVDGEYKAEERLWDGEREDGLISSVGSGNQIIWDLNNKRGFSMRDIDGMFITESNSLQYLLKDLDAKLHVLNI